MQLEPEEFAVLLATHRASSYLERGLVLPCCWKVDAVWNDQPWDLRLPPPLEKLAKAVRDRVAGLGLSQQPKARDRIQSARLFLGEGCPDFSRLKGEFEWGSAWAILAAALFVAAMGVPLDQSVTSSAECPPEGGLRPVGGLQEKSRAARRAGVKKLLVAPAQVRESTQESVDLEVVELKGTELEVQLAQILTELGVHLGTGPLEGLSDWYGLLQLVDQKRARDFYCDFIAKPLGERRRGELSPDLLDADTLVLSATGSVEVPALLATTFQPARVILVPEMIPLGRAVGRDPNDPYVKSCENTIRQVNPRSSIETMTLCQLMDSPAGLLGSVLVDLTGGKTPNRVALSDWASKHSFPRVCIDSTYDRNKPVAVSALVVHLDTQWWGKCESPPGPVAKADGEARA
ncbi:MAG: hypothetical protein O2855_09120 [Planctomycetota bacterium]|nr:hypothetical protein [Planctomycetota bacterium]